MPARDAERARGYAQVEPPARLELRELPAVLNPFSRVAQSPHPAATIVARPSVVAGQRYEEVTKAYIGEVRSVLIGEKAPAAAAEALEHQLIAITGLRRGPPATHAGLVMP